MGAADDLDRWIGAIHGVDDRWIVAAAHAGDARAMRCVAHHIWYVLNEEYERLDTAAGTGLAAGPALPEWAAIHRRRTEIEIRERTRWYSAAARDGDAQALADLDEVLQAAHSSQHWLRARAPGGTYWTDAGPLVCRAGAGEGYASCMLRWAAYLRTLGPGYQAEADQWQERARHGKPDEPPAHGGRISESLDPVAIVMTAAITSAVVPFVQAMVTKAGEDSYNGLRHWLVEMFRRSLPPRHKPDRRDQPLVISPPPGPRPDALLQVWTDLPDEAITALSQLLYDMRTAQPSAPDAERRWYWNSGARRWELLYLPEAHADPGNAESGTPD
jgi:hypothetical protein